jgi:hypothetical protein
MIYIYMECIICFENTSINNYTQLECCKQIVHNECLEKWIKNNINTITDISYCFYCKQKNNNIDYIINIIDNSNVNNNIIIETLETNNITMLQYNNRYKYIIIVIVVILMITIIILTLISVITYIK